ncbi:MAG TPA: alpha/beta fold hydrolase [Micromonosporaceae bacterium]
MTRSSTAPPYPVTFLDRDGDRLALHRCPEPVPATSSAPGAGPAPLVVVWPAMGVPARYYRPLAERLVAAGLAVVVVDLRGTGSSTPRPSHRSGYGYADLASDVGAVLDLLAAESPGRRILLLGHSLGGQACALHLALTADPRVAGLVLVAVGLPWFRSYPGGRALQVLAFTQAIVGVATVLRVWPGWGFGGRQARRLIQDWGFTARHGRFPPLPGRNPDQALAVVTTPVLAISVDGDRYTPAATMDHLCAKMPDAPVRREHLTAAEAGAEIDHFTWVRAADAIVAKVVRFATRG